MNANALALAALSLVPLSSHAFAQTELRPVQDPASALERAKIAEEIGDVAKAEALLREASSAKDAAVASAARDRLAALLVRVGRRDKFESSARPDVAQSAPSGSPIERRVEEAVALLSQTAEAQDRAKNELKWIGEPAIPIFARWIDYPDTSPRVRDTLLEVAYTIGGEPSMALLEKVAGSSDGLTRRKAVEVFRGPNKVSRERFGAVFEKFLTDRDSETRRTAVERLALVPAALKPHVDVLLKDPDGSVRAALIRVPNLLTTAAIDALAHDPVDSTRLALANAIGAHRDWPDATRTLLTLLDDSAGTVRLAALTGLSNRASELKDRAKLEPALRRLAKSDDTQTRINVARNARQLLGPSGTPILLELAGDPESNIAESAINALSTSPQGELRREDIPAVCARQIDLLRRFPISPSEPQGQSGLGDRFLISVLDPYLQRVATREDLSTTANVLAECPSLAEFRNPIASRLLYRAKAEDAPFLCELWKQLSSPPARLIVLNTLANFSGEIPAEKSAAVVALLREALDADQGIDIRVAAARAAIGLGSIDLQDPIVAVLHLAPEESWSAFVSRFEQLETRAPKLASAGLAAIIRRRSETERGFNARVNAMQTLAEMRDPAAMPAVVEVLLDPKGNSVNGRSSLNDAGYALLKQLPPPASVSAFSQLYDRNESIRTHVTQQIPDAEGDVASWLLERPMHSSDAEVRAYAIIGLRTKRAFDERAVAAVLAAAKDANPPVRQAVIQYAKEWNQPKAVPIVRELLKDSDAGIRQEAASALGSLLGEEAVTNLIACLSDDSDEVRAAAKASLEKIRFYVEEKKRWDDWHNGRGTEPGAGARKLLVLLDDPSADVRAAAIESLGTMKAKEALPTLVERLKTAKAPAERDAIAKAIAKINQP